MLRLPPCFLPLIPPSGGNTTPCCEQGPGDEDLNLPTWKYAQSRVFFPRTLKCWQQDNGWTATLGETELGPPSFAALRCLTLRKCGEKNACLGGNLLHSNNKYTCLTRFPAAYQGKEQPKVMPSEDSVDLPGYQATAVMSSGLEPSLIWSCQCGMTSPRWTDFSGKHIYFCFPLYFPKQGQLLKDPQAKIVSWYSFCQQTHLKWWFNVNTGH